MLPKEVMAADMGNTNETMMEYSPIKSHGDAAIYFRVPASIILDGNQDSSRLSAFSFFSIRRGIDNSLTFTINGMARWLMRKPDRHAGGTNEKLSRCVSYLADCGYLSISDFQSETDATLNVSKISDECDNDRFAIIYLDELKSILNRNPKSADATLLVFAWLRMRIARRRNKLLPEEILDTYDKSIDARRKNSPDAYDCHLNEIAYELGLSMRMISKAIDILNDIGLIYSEQLPRTNVNGKWQTNHTIFCNMYKRENGSLLASGEEYYRNEIENKKIKLDKINGER